MKNYVCDFVCVLRYTHTHTEGETKNAQIVCKNAVSKEKTAEREKENPKKIFGRERERVEIFFLKK